MIFIVPIEPIDQRYTKQWYHNIPKDLEKMGMKYRIVGDAIDSGTTSGAFLNFAFTNKYKAKQVQQIADLFSMGHVMPGDKFLVTDAWNFVITAIRYMSDLLDVPVEIHGIWHAGAYDPSDILGMKMKGPSAHNMERSWFHACDYNYYATEFHRSMFLNNLGIEKEHHHKAIRSGQPHRELVITLSEHLGTEKENLVLWPHRYNSDKQPQIAEALNLEITQKLNLSKEDYYAMLGKAKAVFSCSLHENLGISMMEGVMAGAIPIVPDRCSYAEMYLPAFKYPSEWTMSWDKFQEHKQEVWDFIEDKIVNYEQYESVMEQQRGILSEHFMTADIMYSRLMRNL
jgi:hypothetical protein